MPFGTSSHRTLWLVLAVLYGSPLFAQREMMTFGVKAGVPVNWSFEIDRVRAADQTNYQKVFLGLTYETALTKSVSLETDAMYHPEKYRFHRPCIATKSGCIIPELNWETNGYSLEFPIFLKKDWDLASTARLFVETGPSGRSTTMSACTPPEVVCSYRRETHWNLGYNLGGGVDFQGIGFHFYPEARYTRWFFDDELLADTNMHQNLADFRAFLGFSYGFRK
jgi:hypothetical protein